MKYKILLIYIILKSNLNWIQNLLKKKRLSLKEFCFCKTWKLKEKSAFRKWYIFCFSSKFVFSLDRLLWNFGWVSKACENDQNNEILVLLSLNGHAAIKLKPMNHGWNTCEAVFWPQIVWKCLTFKLVA